VKQGKNHVSWNENPPETAAQVVAEAKEKAEGESDTIGSPPKITKTASVATSAEYEEMKKKLERLKAEERRVDSYLGYLKEQAAVFNGRQPPTREQAAFMPPGVKNVSDQMYVRFKDITSMPTYRSETVIGIRAPTGTSLEVPDPDQGMKAGQRRYEMYLSSKGAEGESGRKEVEGNGDPINVYLVQPRADQQNSGSIRSRTGGFVEGTPPSQRGPHPPAEQAKHPAAGPPGEAHRQSYGGPPPRHGEHPYGYGGPSPKHGGEWGYGPPGSRPPYPAPDRGQRKGSSRGPPGAPYPPMPYGDPAWGPPPYQQGYSQPPPGYYPPTPRQPPPGSQHSPQSEKQGSDSAEPDKTTSDRPREDNMSRQFHPPHDGDEPSPNASNPSPFRPRQHHFQHEVGRTASAGGENSRDASFRPPSPGREQALLTMPLQSPTGPFGFGTPPGAPPRTDVRPGNVQFPIPSFPRESIGYNDRWRPPLPKPPGSSQQEDPPHSHGPSRSHR
jgi:hypothetical protein